MRKIGSKKRFALIATTTAAVLVGSGVAFAYWTTTGSGNGTAATGTSSVVAITQTNTVTGLYPGGPAQTLQLNINNSNVSGQYVGIVTVAVVNTTIGAVVQAGCTAADFVVTNGTINAVVPAGTVNPYNASGATVKMIDTGVPQNACKGVTVNLSYTA